MKRFLQIIIAAFFLLGNVLAQPGSNDTTFNVLDDCTGRINGLGPNSGVIAVVQGNKFIVAGSFDNYNGITRNAIARINHDGTIDTLFNPGIGFDGSVSTIAVQTDGKVIVSGTFSSFNGIPRNKLVRLNFDGSLDLSFNVGTGLSHRANSISIQNDGKIIIGGDFQSVNSTSKNCLARLNSDGTVDGAFNIGNGFNLPVYTTEIQPDGKILVGGYFTTYNGNTTNRIVRLNTNGTIDATFNSGTGINNTANNALVTKTNIQADGKILIGGNFMSYNGATRYGIIRLNTDGTLDNSFNLPGPGFASISSMKIQTDGKIIISGGLGNINPASPYISRLNTNGSFDLTFIAAQMFTFSPGIQIIQSDGKIIVGCVYNTNLLPRSRNGITRLNTDGTLDLSFNPPAYNLIVTTNQQGGGSIDFIHSITTQNDGKIIVAGSLGLLSTIPVTQTTTYGFNVIRLENNGLIDTIFYHNMCYYWDDVYTTSLQSDGKIIVGGKFTDISFRYPTLNYSRNRILRLNSNGSLDTLFNIGTGFNSTVRATAVQPDGKILVGGDFFSYNGTSRNRIARLNANGSIDLSFSTTGTGFNGPIYSISLQSDGKIIVGGDFTSYNGIAKFNIARLNTDGTLDNTFNMGSGFSDIVFSTKIQTDGKIVVCGRFNFFNTTNCRKIARLNTNGTIDPTFSTSGTGLNGTVVYSIALQTDGKIVIGGDYSNYNGITRPRIARLNSDGTLDTSFNPGSGFTGNPLIGGSSEVYTTCIQQDGKILVGGSFTNYNGICRTKIARLNGTCSTITPTGSTSQTFCTSATIASLVANGTSIQWYSTASGGIALTSSTPLINGTTYYATQTLSGCESTNRLAVAVTINNTAAPTGSVNQTFCAGSTIANLVANGTNIQWYSTSNGGTALSSSTLLTNGTTYYATQTVSGCESTARLAVSVILNLIAAPTGSASQLFCNSATIANIVANGTNLQWYSTASGGTALSSTTPLTNGTTYYASQTVSGCESTTRLAVTVNVASTAVPAPTGSTNQSFCNSGTLASLVANGTNLQWYSTASGGTALSSSAQLVNGSTYYAAQTVSGCQSNSRLAVTVTIINTAAPTGSAVQAFCNGATIANLVAVGSNVQWFSTASGGTPLSASTALTNGVTYYAAQTVSGCVSTSRLAVRASVSTSSAFSEICLVSVDNNDGKNIVIWEKAANQRIKYYKIYKQNTVNSQYDSIAFVPIDSFSTFKDFNSNPSQQSNSYKISAVDSCGIEGPLLNAHTTIHLSANQGVNNNVNLQWNAYSGFTYPNFEIYRSNNGSAYALIGSVANTTFSFTDLTPPAGTNYYYVSVTKPTPCNPSKAAAVLRSISNTLDGQGNSVISSTVNIPNTNAYNIYPNPTSSIINIEKTGSLGITEVSIYDVLGRKLSSIMPGNNSLIQMEMPQIPGTYYISIEDENGKRELFKVLKI